MSESTTEKAVTAEPVETGNSVQQVAQEPSGPGNRQGGGEWPDPDTPPKGLVEYDPQRVPLNMYETTEALVLVLPLPGVMADDVTIDIEDDRVHVNAAQRPRPRRTTSPTSGTTAPTSGWCRSPPASAARSWPPSATASWPSIS